MYIGIVVDSATDLNETLLGCKRIIRVPFIMEIDSGIFVDNVDLDREDYLLKMENSQTPPKSAAPAPQTFLDAYDKNDFNFVITISTFLSGSYNSALAAKNMLLEECKDKAVHIFDSRSACAGQTLVAIKLKEMIDLNIENEIIISTIQEFIQDMRTYFVLESYENLVKNGRMNPYIAKVAKVLSIFPICKASQGKIELSEKVRGYKKALSKLITIISQEKIDLSQRTLSISHVNSEQRALKLRDDILNEVSFKEVIIQEASGLCSNYAERGGIVIAY